MTNREGMSYASKVLVSVAIGMALTACTSSQETRGEPTVNYTYARVDRIREEASQAGYALGLREGRKRAESVWNQAYAAGIASICRMVFGSGPTNADGWRVHVNAYGDLIANKASVWWWLIGFGNEVPTRFTAQECLARARDYRDGVNDGQ